ncbi:MAG: hypothetical protein RLZZ501_2231 [Pseudomonadota bacterium]|jgi:threonine/homoserine/homoserine lactone efflux protein
MPLETGQIAGFLLAALAVTVAPGPDNLMVLSLGLSRGRRAGMAFGIGCGLGCLSHTLLAALGLAALIQASPGAFLALRLCGGAYLVWLGIGAWRGGGSFSPPPAAGPTRLAPLFWRGLLANAINPKVILFFLAFLPQFVIAGRGDEAGQIALLGGLFAVQAALLFGLLGALAGRIGGWLHRRPGVGKWLDRCAGGVLIALGARLMVTR